MMIIPIILTGIVIFAVYKLYNSPKADNTRSEALDILNKKYANGEISEEEYIKKKKDISG